MSKVLIYFLNFIEDVQDWQKAKKLLPESGDLKYTASHGTIQFKKPDGKIIYEAVANIENPIITFLLDRIPKFLKNKKQ